MLSIFVYLDDKLCQHSHVLSGKFEFIASASNSRAIFFIGRCQQSFYCRCSFSKSHSSEPLSSLYQLSQKNFNFHRNQYFMGFPRGFQWKFHLKLKTKVWPGRKNRMWMGQFRIFMPINHRNDHFLLVCSVLHNNSIVSIGWATLRAMPF